MNKKTDNFSHSLTALIRLACCFILLAVLMVAFTAFAGGSIFGGKKSKAYNPGGVYAIGVHFCSTTDCPPIRIVEGTCDGEHMQKRYGVCVCDEGYVSQGDSCVACPEGQYSDGINGCTDCAPGTYKQYEADTECTPCPAGSYCKNGIKVACPEHAICEPVPASSFACLSSYHKTSTGCICADGSFVDGAGECKVCSSEPQAKTCSGGKIVECKTGYYPVESGIKCQSCSVLHAAECNGKTGAVIKCEDGYYNQSGKCVECPEEYYCRNGEKIACPAHAECKGVGNDDFVCIDEHKKNAKDDACVCEPKPIEYEDPEDGYKCKACPPEPSCAGVECCELTGPKDVCDRKTKSLRFKGNPDAYGNSCYECTNTKDIEGVIEDQCARCPTREYYKVGTVETCFAQKCGDNAFRDKKYGDCYDCTYERGIKAEKDQCDKCSNRVMAGEMCVLKCPEGQILDTSNFTCVSCTTDDDIEPLGDDCTKACPGVRELNYASKCVRTCSGHGHEEKHKCVCDTRWFGEKCDSLCETAWGKDEDGEKKCYLCDVKGKFESTESECNRCEEREWQSGYCYLKNCVSDTFRGASDVCFSCDDMDSVKINDTAQCNRCTSLLIEKREVVVRSGLQYCEMTDEICAGKGGFKDIYGNCHKCGAEDDINAEEDECNRCTGRLFVSGVCYPACPTDSFRDKAHVCHACTDTTSYETETADCNLCSTKRTMVGTFCIPTACGDAEIFDLTTHKCVSCYAADVRPIDKADCAGKCGGVREIVADACVLACSGHGIKEGGLCKCDGGWYGPKCDSDCNGFKDGSNVCYGCENTKIIASVTRAECDRCPDRAYDEVAQKCFPPCTGFRSRDLQCHDCDTTENITETDKDECGNCPTRVYSEVNSTCYPPCEGFRDSAGLCHACADEKGYEATSTECGNCSENRMMVSTYCVLKCEGEGHILDLITHKCVSCLTETIQPLAEEKCTQQCPGIREVVAGSCVLACNGHGIKEAGECQCDTGWYGTKCDSDCPGFRDDTSPAKDKCHACADATARHVANKEECDRCPDRIYVAATGMCNPPCAGFKDVSGACHECSDATSPKATADECNRCSGDRQMVNNYCAPKCKTGEIYDVSTLKCVSCLAENVVPITDDECTSRCPADREIVDGHCVLACSGHGTRKDTLAVVAGEAAGVGAVGVVVGSFMGVKTSTCVCNTGWYGEKCDSDCNGFKDTTNVCHPCDDNKTRTTFKGECDRCPTRLFDGINQCYTPCETGFRGPDGTCHECTDNGFYTITYKECFRACTKDQREKVGDYCVPKCVEPKEIYDIDDKQCKSCYDPDVRAISKEECEGRCTKDGEMIREYVDGVCRFTCSGHGTKKDGKCTCHPGWFGEKCDSECDGFWDASTPAVCRGCRDENAWASTEPECARCPNRAYKAGTCHPTCTPNNGFEDGYGTCRSCTDEKSYASTKKECDNCPQREYIGNTCYLKCESGEFRDANRVCRSCSEAGPFPAYKTDCDACGTARTYENSKCYKACSSTEFRDTDGYCRSCTDLTPYNASQAECGSCDTTRFRDTDGVCRACGESSATTGISSTRDECGHCSARTWFGSMCYSSCGSSMFRDAYGYCRSCSDAATYVAYNVECSKCGSARTYSGSHCSKK